VATNDRFRTIVLDCCLTKSIGRVRFSLDRLILVFALYIMHSGHWILVHCDLLQSYDKVSINIVVYITSTATKCVKKLFISLFHISLHFLEFQAIEKTTLICFEPQTN